MLNNSEMSPNFGLVTLGAGEQVQPGPDTFGPLNIIPNQLSNEGWNSLPKNVREIPKDRARAWKALKRSGRTLALAFALTAGSFAAEEALLNQPDVPDSLQLAGIATTAAALYATTKKGAIFVDTFIHPIAPTPRGQLIQIGSGPGRIVYEGLSREATDIVLSAETKQSAPGLAVER